MDEAQYVAGVPANPRPRSARKTRHHLGLNMIDELGRVPDNGRIAPWLIVDDLVFGPAPRMGRLDARQHPSPIHRA